MPKGRIKVVRAIPGATSLGPILLEFSRQPAGTVTAFSDSLLPICRQFLGDNSPIDVLSFGEIVRNLLLLCAEDAGLIAPSGHKQAAIAHACSLLDDDSPFARAWRFEGFHEAIGSVLDELHSWGIFEDQLEELVPLVNARLAAKLKSLAAIDRSVKEVLGRLGREQHTDQLLASLDLVPELEGDFERMLVFASGEQSPLRLLWIKWLAENGIDVTVVFDRHATDASIFAGVEQSIELLGVDPVDRGDGNRLMRNLFAGEQFDGAPVSVAVESAADPLAECEWALRRCLGRENPSRSAIYVRDLEAYAPLLESAARRLDVPIRLSRRAPLLTNSFARLTLAALKFCASNDVRSLSPLVRSSYLRLPGTSQANVVTQLRTCYALKSGQWQALEDWAEAQEAEYAWLRALLSWRKRGVGSHLRLPEWYALIKEFNREQQFPWVALENKGGQMDERDRRAQNQMERLLANHISVDEVTDTTTMSLGEFVALCDRLWTAGDVSIPSSDSGVLVSATPDALGDIDDLHVLGMLEGVFPRRRAEDPVLTDEERSAISRLRPEFPPLPDSHSKAGKERDEFYKVCAAAKATLTFSYPQADDERDNIPAFYLTEVERAAGAVNRTDHPRPELAPIADEVLSEADRKLRDAIDGPRQSPLPIEIAAALVRKSLVPAEGTRFDPHTLRNVLQCPFQHFARDVLHLQVKRQAARWNSLRKLPQVALLVSTPDLEQAERSMMIALEAELDKLYSEVPEWELQLLRSGGQRLIIEWLRRERASRELWPKQEGSVKANVSFGTHGVRDELPGGLRLQGSIPAISKLQRYNVAHLYGSGPIDAKKQDNGPLNETEQLYFGLHLCAIHEAGREGALEIETTSGKRWLLVLGRDGAQPLASSVAEGLQVVDLGTEDEPSKLKERFYDPVKDLLKKAKARIEEPAVDAISGDHCQRCDFGELCRQSSEFGEDESPFDDEGERSDA